MKKFLLSFVLIAATVAGIAQKTINDPNAEVRTVSGFHGAHKERRHDRMAWALAFKDLIQQVAIGQSDKWLEAEEPFAFLAACMEVNAMHDFGPHYTTRLPI